MVIIFCAHFELLKNNYEEQSKFLKVNTIYLTVKKK
jgi:hypothetical protein